MHYRPPIIGKFRALVADLQRGTVFVSDNFARLYDVDIGDRIMLETPGGSHEFLVSHHREDYSWPMGIIFMDRTLYADLWQDHALSFLDIQLRDPARLDELQADLTRRFRSSQTL